MKKMNVFLLSLGFLLSIQSSFAEIKCVNIEKNCYSYVNEGYNYYYSDAVAVCTASVFITNDDNTSETLSFKESTSREIRNIFDPGFADTSLAKSALESDILQYKHYPSCDRLSDVRAD